MESVKEDRREVDVQDSSSEADALLQGRPHALWSAPALSHLSPGTHAWVKPRYDWMKGTSRNTIDRQRTCRLQLPALDFVMQVPTRQQAQVYTDASEEETGFALQVQHRPIMGLFLPARTKAWKRAVGLHREAHGLYVVAKRPRGLWRNAMQVRTDSIPLYANYFFANL
eukprot:GHVT01061159.1.p1 GENE.GHVT01061159.1~~GHVT01061159.1.p1  ORF type:complete len:169 (+),score=8.39 GHVT01061159.1:232-738(+)